jgi:hypothetical protein
LIGARGAAFRIDHHKTGCYAVLRPKSTSAHGRK